MRKQEAECSHAKPGVSVGGRRPKEGIVVRKTRQGMMLESAAM